VLGIDPDLAESRKNLQAGCLTAQMPVFGG
jgi:hypothetical protein